MEECLEQTELVHLAADVVAAYVSNNTVVAAELPTIINDVYDALNTAAVKACTPPQEEYKPAVSIKKSIQPDYLICLEDGQKFKSLKRHLKTHYDMSPEEYREKWSLPHDYPMVAPNYSEKRRSLAKKMKLGHKR
ncbi:MAG: MucR family transcriptional regulator [Hyphomicrobiaceae bacterium]|nr:MucR family transcriptional regulator [Hyphomicrobiaceae bacterium]